MSAPTMMMERVLRPHPSNSVICCKPYQETKHNPLSFTREYQHPTTKHLLSNNGSYVNAAFEYFGTVALPYVHGLSQFSRSYRFNIKKTIPEGKELYIAIKEGVEIFMQAWDSKASVYHIFCTLSSSSLMAHNWIGLDLFQLPLTSNGLADRISMKELPENYMAAMEKHTKVLVEGNYCQNRGSWTPRTLLNSPTDMRPAYRQYITHENKTPIIAEPGDTAPIPNVARKKVTFSPDVVNYTTEIRRLRSAYNRSRSRSTYVPGRYACPSKEGWIDTSFSNSRTRTIRQCKIFITQDPSDMELEKPPSIQLCFTNTRSRRAVLQKLKSLAIHWVDRLLKGCRRGVVAEAERMINRCDAILILRDCVDLNSVLEVRPFILERDKEQDTYLKRRKRGNDVKRLLTFVNERKSRDMIQEIGLLCEKLTATEEEEQESGKHSVVARER